MPFGVPEIVWLFKSNMMGGAPPILGPILSPLVGHVRLFISLQLAVIVVLHPVHGGWE